MDITSEIILNAFLQSCDPEIRERLTALLPQEEVEILSHLETPMEDPTHGLKPSGELIDAFHTSWFAPFLRTLSTSDIEILLAAFSPAAREHLSKELGFVNHPPRLTKSAHAFLKKFLIDSLKKDVPPLLPIECIPKNPFNRLLYFSYPQKLKLLDLLSIHDLAYEMKTIIEKETLAHIKTLLTEEEREYLTLLLKHKETVHFKSMNLKEWDGAPDTLRTLLRQRGINRLSKALFGTDPSFIWYFKHGLDTSSASLFQKLHAPMDNLSARKTLQEQVLNLIDIFKEQIKDRL